MPATIATPLVLHCVFSEPNGTVVLATQDGAARLFLDTQDSSFRSLPKFQEGSELIASLEIFPEGGN